MHIFEAIAHVCKEKGVRMSDIISNGVPNVDSLPAAIRDDVKALLAEPVSAADVEPDAPVDTFPIRSADAADKKASKSKA